MTPTPDVAISLNHVSHWYANRPVLTDLSLQIPKGKVTALLGLNGAGKTTTMRILMGLIDPTKGDCLTLGRNSKAMDAKTLQRIGYVVEDHFLPRNMRPEQIEKFCESARPTWNHSLFHEIVEHFGIHKSQKVAELSRGQRAGVSLASVLAGMPELLVLDDPSLGLDPVSRRSLNETLLMYMTKGDEEGASRTILLSTHQIEDVERIADDIALILHGQLCVHAPMSTFEERVHRYSVDLGVNRETGPMVREILKDIPSTIEVQHRLDQLVVSVAHVPSDSSSESNSLQQQIEDATGCSVKPISSSFNDRVLAYLARERKDQTWKSAK